MDIKRSSNVTQMEWIWNPSQQTYSNEGRCVAYEQSKQPEHCVVVSFDMFTFENKNKIK